MTDSFMQKHQSAIDRQIEENEINWLFGDPDDVEDEENYPMEDDYDG